MNQLKKKKEYITLSNIKQSKDLTSIFKLIETGSINEPQLTSLLNNSNIQIIEK